MARPQRNLVLLVLLVAVLVLLGGRVPVEVAWWLSGAAMAGLGFVAWLGRRFFNARALLSQRRLEVALLETAAFEQELTKTAWRRALAFLYVGVFSSNGVAVARNLLGSIRLEQGQLDDAKAHFERALAEDASYAVPVANLAVVAAMQGRAEDAERDRLRARALGFRRKSLDAAIASALAKAGRSSS
jgi:tetratricopeptide (TPR) repeat protein